MCFKILLFLYYEQQINERVEKILKKIYTSNINGNKKIFCEKTHINALFAAQIYWLMWIFNIKKCTAKELGNIDQCLNALYWIRTISTTNKLIKQTTSISNQQTFKQKTEGSSRWHFCKYRKHPEKIFQPCKL